jgi:hypothetical protein
MSTTPTTDSLLDFAMSAHDAANPTEVATLADRILHSGVAAFEMFSIYLGDRLGWYRSLADDGPATAAELAARTGSTERYTREWLEQQAVAGLIEVDAGEPDSRFRLSPESTEVLTDTSSMAYLAPLGPRASNCIVSPIPTVGAAEPAGLNSGQMPAPPKPT